MLLLEQLEIARCALERRQTAWSAAPPLDPATPIEGGNDRGGTHDSSDQERPDAAALLCSVHRPDLTIVRVRVCALGDLAMDVTVRFQGPLAQDADTAAEIRVSAGGQAANVAAWASVLGANASVVGKRGADLAGELVRAELERRRVRVLGPVDGTNAVVCVLVSADGHRSLLPDRGAARELRPEEIEPTWLEGCDHLFVSGYALFHEPARAAALRASALAREVEAAVSVDLSSWSELEAVGTRKIEETVERLGPNVVFANEDEERLVGRFPGVTWIVKRGAQGCSFDGDERAALPVGHVVDTTGAGDALAAGWIVGGPDLALEAAARCVQQLASMPMELPA